MLKGDSEVSNADCLKLFRNMIDFSSCSIEVSLLQLRLV